MTDKDTNINELKKWVEEFTVARDWNLFHSPKNLSQALVIEATELMEIFLWSNDQDSKKRLDEKRKAVEEEVVDVLYWLLQFSWQYNIDLTAALQEKMKLNNTKYPVEKAKGNTLKYTELST